MRTASRWTAASGLPRSLWLSIILCVFAVAMFVPETARAQGNDDVWRPSTGNDDVWTPEDAAGGDDVWTPEQSGDDESWTDSDSDDETFFEEKDDADEAVYTAPTIEQFYGKHFITLEYRDTTVFDDSRDAENELHIGPPPETLTYVAYGIALNRINYLKVETEYQEYAPPIDPEAQDVPTDGGWTLVSWDRSLSSGSRLYLDAGTSWSSDSSGGFNMSGEYGWSMGNNLDVAAGLRYTMSSSGGPGWRASGKATAFISTTTSAQYKGWYAVDSTGYRGSRNQLKCAQYLGMRTGLHLMARSNVTSSDDYPDKRSRVFGIEARHRLPAVDTQLRLGYRWYADNASVDHTDPVAEDVEAEGISFGVSQPFYRGSVAVYYRHYTTSADVDAGSWWMVLDLTF